MAPGLPRWRKLGYGVADFGASLSYNAINFFLLFFLVNILELRPALAGSVLLLGRTIDAITDPLMGLITDRTRSRWGRRMPYIWFGLLPLAASFALLWMIPAGTQAAMFIVAALALSLHTILFTVVQVPYLSLTPDLAPSYGDRTSLTSYRIGFGTLASLVAAAAPPLIVAAADPATELSQTSPEGWMMMGAAFAAAIAIAYTLMALLVREPKLERPERRPLALFGELKTALRIYGFLPLVLLFMVITLGLGVISSMLPFYLDSNLRLGAELQTVTLGLLFVTAILSLPLWNVLAGRTDKRSALAVGLVVLALALLLLVGLAPPGMSAYLLAMSTIAGVGVGAILLFPWAMLPDVVEFDELATGHRREGLVYAIFTFGQKVAFALGVFVNGQVQERTGYEPGALAQSDAAIAGIAFMVGPAAAVIFLVALLFLWRFPVSRARHEAAMRELKARAGAMQEGSR